MICPDCHHEHAGSDLAFICVGCPCSARPYPEPQESKPPPIPTLTPRRLFCATHGRKPWSGQVICIQCDAVWHLNVEDPPTGDGKCTCGSELNGKRGTARAICADCYAERKAGLS